MASNPMQRQKTISFWMGVLVAILVSSLIIGGLGYMLFTKIKAENELKQSMVQVYTLNKDVSSGQAVTSDMLTMLTVSKKTVPANAISEQSIFSTYSLQDEKGNEIYTDSEGKMFVKENDLKIELKKNNDGSNTYTKYINQDNDGNIIYMDEQGMYIKKQNINSNNDEDENDEENNTSEEKIRIQKDEEGVYTKKENNRSVKVTIKQVERAKDITLSTVALVAKVNMKANTIITRELVAQSDEVNTADVRNQEFNMITLPATLATGDFVDIRMRMPNGVDYIVVAKKEVSIPDIAGVPAEDTIQVKMSEGEILTMSNAIVEAYIMKGSELYATKYTDPGNQKKADVTYPISQATMRLIEMDDNIIDVAKNALSIKYNKNEDQRNRKNDQLYNYSEESTDNIEEGIQEQIQKQKELRKKYLEALNGSTY